jgi:arylsulfatase A-like enzyme
MSMASERERKRAGRGGSALLVVAILGGSVAEAFAAQPRRPNVVLIVADDLGYGDLGVHGGKDIPTPNIDKLAAQGTRCSSGYVSCPYCSPTRAGLLTARYQQRFGHEFNPGGVKNAEEVFGLSLDEKTVAERVKPAGYATALVGKWHLGTARKFQPLSRGFDEFYGFLGGAHPYFPVASPENPIQRGFDPVEPPAYLTDAITSEAESFIDRNKERPFLLYVAYNAVHNPQHAKPEHLEKFKAIADERRRTYAGMLASLDEGVGKVLAKLDETGLDKDTLVFFVSDNGGPEANGSTNGPLNGQKATTWEGGIRVPYLVRWPGKVPAGAEYRQPVIQLDITPTILAATGVSVPDADKLDGVNLLPFLSGENKAAPHERLYWRFGPQIALREGDWKLLKVRGDSELRLYNLASDIGETRDLASTEPERVKKLQAAWDAWNGTLIEPKWVPNAQRADRPAAKKKATKT